MPLIVCALQDEENEAVVDLPPSWVDEIKISPKGTNLNLDCNRFCQTISSVVR